MVGARVDGGSPFKAYALQCVADSTLRYHWRGRVVCFVEHAADCPELLRQPDKRAHRLASKLAWNEALVWVDERFEYDELRMIGLIPEGNRLYCLAFVDRGKVRRIISLRHGTCQ